MEMRAATDSFPILMAKHSAPGQEHYHPAITWTSSLPWDTCTCPTQLIWALAGQTGKPCRKSGFQLQLCHWARSSPYTSATPIVKQVITITIIRSATEEHYPWARLHISLSMDAKLSCTFLMHSSPRVRLKHWLEQELCGKAKDSPHGCAGPNRQQHSALLNCRCTALYKR